MQFPVLAHYSRQILLFRWWNKRHRQAQICFVLLNCTHDAPFDGAHPLMLEKSTTGIKAYPLGSTPQEVESVDILLYNAGEKRTFIAALLHPAPVFLGAYN